TTVARNHGDRTGTVRDSAADTIVNIAAEVTSFQNVRDQFSSRCGLSRPRAQMRLARTGDILVSAFCPSTGPVARFPDAQRWGQHAAWAISRSETLDALCRPI